MRVLVTGAGGMLGSALLSQRSAGIVGLTEEQLDILDEPAVRSALATHKPGWVINCAAFTNVDGCEGNEAAYRVNALGPGLLARACRFAGVRLLQVSTDYVFDGSAQRPYREDDPPNPLNAYGRGKFDGERNALAEHPDGVTVVRTAWLFGENGRCFPRSILAAARRGQPLRVVADQTGSPTYAADLAAGLIALLALGPPPGTLHLTNSGVATWHELATATLRFAGLTNPITPIATADWQTPAARPAYSVLDCSKALSLGVPPLRPWQEALAEFVANVG